MNTPSNSPVTYEEKMFRKVCDSPYEWLWIKSHRSTGHLVLIYAIFSLGLTVLASIMISSYTVIEKMNISRLFPYKCIRNQFDLAIM